MSEIIEKVKEFVKKECNKNTSKYGNDVYDYHFVPMVKYAKKLAKKQEADIEIVELSGWLHDIGSIIKGRKDHHLTGSEIAEKKLKELEYPNEKIEIVKKCILNHRGSRNDYRETKEEQVIAEADAMSNFEDITGLFKAAFLHENKSREEAKKSVLQKLENKYRQVSEENKKLIKPRYEAVKLLLK